MKRALILVVAVAAMATASAKMFITPHNPAIAKGFAPTAAPNCYTGKQIYTGKSACFGGTALGGPVGVGTLIQTDEMGTSVQTIYEFDVFHGLMPSQSPILYSDGRTLIGTASEGGSSGSGLVFAFNLANKTITTLASFTGPGGSTPQAPPIEVNGTIYGTAGQGGAYGYGVIWSLVPGGTVKVLHNFAGGLNDTATPFGALTYNPADRLLYGMAFAFAKNGMGAVFSIGLNGSGYTIRATFTPETGYSPQIGALLLSKDGGMYANGWLGGTNKLGTIFRFDPKTSALKAVFSYTTATGNKPYNSLAESPSGKWLYSVTWLGGKTNNGTVVAVAKNGTTYKVLLDADRPKTGGASQAGATVSISGNYIITQMSIGGRYGGGTVLSLEIPKDVR